ncbi:MAG: hypothetical protein QOJ15_8163 [Bradyrhizobium sp.]|jgi:RNA polymerase sigma-70 factor (ECF subfamily)|nr:hypothetical protein [Bradyrhizobium sp.]
MTNSNRPSLRQWLTAGYTDIRRRLTRRLGSEELASEVLHETYLRLDGAGDAAAVKVEEGLADLNRVGHVKVSG